MLAIRPFARLILTVHDPDPHSGADSRLPFISYWLMRLGRRLASVIVVHGEFNERLFDEIYPHRASQVIRSQHGVLMVPATGQKTRAPRSILMFGRMQRYKGLETLIAASEILNSRSVQHKVIVAGTGPEANRLLSEMRGRKSFELRLRYIMPAEAADLFQSSDVVVLPYLDATQSGVAAAAFANRRAVVASRVGGLADLVDDGVNGLLVEPGNAVALADALQRVLEDDNLRFRLMAGARETAETTLNWNRIADELIANLSERA
jgi:glycosyltransferase involved in cell wall biosynthesis